MFQLQLLTSAAHIQYNCRLQCNKFLSFNNKHFTNACILRAVVADTTGCARYLWTRLPITTSINTSSFYLFTFVFTSRRIYYCRVAASRLTQNMKPHAALIQVTTAPLYSCGKILGFRGETGAHKWKKKNQALPVAIHAVSSRCRPWWTRTLKSQLWPRQNSSSFKWPIWAAKRPFSPN